MSCIYLYVLVLYGAVHKALHISQFAANPPPSLHCRVASPQSPGSDQDRELGTFMGKAGITNKKKLYWVIFPDIC